MSLKKNKKVNWKETISIEFNNCYEKDKIITLFSRRMYYNFASFIGLIILIVGIGILSSVPNGVSNATSSFASFLIYFGLAVFIFFKALITIFAIQLLDLCRKYKMRKFRQIVIWWMVFYIVGDIYLLKIKKLKINNIE